MDCKSCALICRSVGLFEAIESPIMATFSRYSDGAGAQDEK